MGRRTHAEVEFRFVSYQLDAFVATKMAVGAPAMPPSLEEAYWGYRRAHGGEKTVWDIIDPFCDPVLFGRYED